MRTLYLHIGMHKTGTSAFQAGCAECRNELYKRGFVYHQDELSQTNQNHFLWLARSPTRASLETSIRNALELGPQGQQHLISGEDISYMTDEEFSWLIGILEEYFDSIKIVGVLRQPISYMRSAAQEILKEPMTTMQALMRRRDVSPCYRFRFEKALSAVGRSNCQFFSYTNRIVDELCEFMQMPVKPRFRVENKSMSLGVAILLNEAKLQPPSVENPIDTFEGVKSLIQKFDSISIDHRTFQVPREIVEAWQNQIQSDLNWLATVWTAPPDYWNEEFPRMSLAEFGA
jgi:hypothetical protein